MIGEFQGNIYEAMKVNHNEPMYVSTNENTKTELYRASIGITNPHTHTFSTPKTIMGIEIKVDNRMKNGEFELVYQDEEYAHENGLIFKSQIVYRFKIEI